MRALRRSVLCAAGVVVVAALAGCGGSARSAPATKARKATPAAAKGSPTISATALKSCIDASGASSSFIDALAGANSSLSSAGPVLAGFNGSSGWARRSSSNAKQIAGDNALEGLDIYVLPTATNATAAISELGSTAKSDDNAVWVVAGAGAGSTVPSGIEEAISTCVTAGATVGGDPAPTSGSSTKMSGGEYTAIRAAAGDLAVIVSYANLSKERNSQASGLATAVAPLLSRYASNPSSSVLQEIAALDAALVNYNNFGEPTSLNASQVKTLEQPQQPSTISPADDKEASKAGHEILTVVKGQPYGLLLPTTVRQTLGQFLKATAAAVRPTFPNLASLLDPTAASSASSGGSESSSPARSAPPTTPPTPATISCGTVDTQSFAAFNLTVTGMSCGSAGALLQQGTIVGATSQLQLPDGYTCEEATVVGKPGTVCRSGSASVAFQNTGG